MRDDLLQHPRIPQLQKADHLFQRDGKATGVLARIPAGNDPVFQQPVGLPLADVADAIELIHGNGFREFFAKMTIVHFGTSQGKIHSGISLLLSKGG